MNCPDAVMSLQSKLGPLTGVASRQLSICARQAFKAWVMLALVVVSATGNAQELTTASGTISPADLTGIYAGTVRPFTLKITNTGVAPLQVSRITLPKGVRGWGGDSCIYPAVPPGGNCIYELAVGSDVPGPGSGEIVIQANVATGSFAVPMSWTISTFPIQVSAASLVFGEQQVGTVSLSQTLTVTNVGTAAFNLSASVVPSHGCLGVPPPGCLEFVDEEIASFPVVSSCSVLAPMQSCKIEVAFAPRSLQVWHPSLAIRTADTGRSIKISGVGVPLQKVAGTVLAVSYVRSSRIPYRWFLTVARDEIDKLDTGTIEGWERTGESFWVYPSDFVGNVTTHPVCRFYGRLEAGVDGHFYTASSEECAQVLQRFPNAWQLESEAFFRVGLPDFVTGSCPSGMSPIYRIYSTLGGDHHIYTLSRSLAVGPGSGYVSEGYGPDGVVMCAAQ